MKTRIMATNIELTDSIENYLEEKLVSVEKFISAKETVPKADIELAKKTNHHNSGDDLYVAEINLEIGGNFYRYVAEESELYAAIDKMKDEIIQELRDGKAKKRDLFRRGALKMKNMLRRPRGGDDL